MTNSFTLMLVNINDKNNKLKHKYNNKCSITVKNYSEIYFTYFSKGSSKGKL